MNLPANGISYAADVTYTMGVYIHVRAELLYCTYKELFDVHSKVPKLEKAPETWAGSGQEDGPRLFRIAFSQVGSMRKKGENKEKVGLGGVFNEQEYGTEL